MNQGHFHPKILAAMVEQASKPTLTSRAFHNDQLALFYEQIAELTGSHKVLPMNSGAEAVESAIKSVRKWGYEVKGVPDGQTEIIVCADNFHGRTLGIIGFSTDAAAPRCVTGAAPSRGVAAAHQPRGRAYFRSRRRRTGVAAAQLGFAMSGVAERLVFRKFSAIASSGSCAIG